MEVCDIMREPVKKILAQMFDFYKQSADGVIMPDQFSRFWKDQNNKDAKTLTTVQMK